ncbi:hypothetical protein V1511DRAFT_490070 [Dipodascopsis uninucleata]
MSNVVAEFENILQSMLELKAPGVSGTKIRRLTDIAIQSVQSESVLIQKLYTHFKRAPASHKLGSLYVVDAIARAYQDEARKLGEVPSPDSPEGTPAAGLYHLTDIIDTLMSDIAVAPPDQRDKILKVVDIWERASTFNPETLTKIRNTFAQATANSERSTTPPNPPPAYLLSERTDSEQTNGNGSGIAANGKGVLPSTSSILEALASMAKQNGSDSASKVGTEASDSTTALLNSIAPPPGPSVTTSLPNSSVPTPSILDSLSQFNGSAVSTATDPRKPVSATDQLGALTAALQQQSGQRPNQQNPYSQVPPMQHNGNGNIGAGTPDLNSLLPLLSGQGSNNFYQRQQPQAPSTNGFQIPGMPGFGGAPPNPLAPPAPEMSQQGGVDQQIALMQLLLSQNVPINQIATLLQAMPVQSTASNIPVPTQGMISTWTSGDDRGRLASSRSPTYGNRRSRSPPRHRRRSRSPSYRARSPRGSRRSDSPNARLGHETIRADIEIKPKSVTMDPMMPQGCIKVLSRTLFVGGIPQSMSEERLISIFEQAAKVQGIIMNKEKRHAFMKVYYRSDAELIKNTMETYTEGDVTLRTRWGVGFGPRDCCDYSCGISTIPIDRLTEADKRWIVTAEFGGTDGRPLEAGMVVEEPDIEIGAGVSSKAISKRMPTNSGGDLGPKSTIPPDAAAAAARRRSRRR